MEGNLNGSIYTNIIGYEGEVQLQYSGTGMMGMGAGGFGGFGGGRGQMPEGMELPEGAEPGQMPERMELPEGVEVGQRPDGVPNGMGRGQGTDAESEPSTTFTISGVQNMFSQITEA